MSQITRNLTDDLVFMVYADKYPVKAGPGLRQTGWRGGLFVMYVPPTDPVDEYVVEVSDGTMCCGFLSFPSEAYDPGEEWGAVNNYTGVQLRDDQGSVSGASTVTVNSSGGRYLWKMYETVAIGPGGLRDGSGGNLVYQLNEDLKVSENGFLCNDPDARLALVGIATPVVVGICSAVPTAWNAWYLGADIKR